MSQNSKNIPISFIGSFDSSKWDEPLYFKAVLIESTPDNPFKRVLYENIEKDEFDALPLQTFENGVFGDSGVKKGHIVYHED